VNQHNDFEVLRKSANLFGWAQLTTAQRHSSFSRLRLRSWSRKFEKKNFKVKSV